MNMTSLTDLSFRPTSFVYRRLINSSHSLREWCKFVRVECLNSRSRFDPAMAEETDGSMNSLGTPFLALKDVNVPLQLKRLLFLLILSLLTFFEPVKRLQGMLFFNRVVILSLTS